MGDSNQTLVAGGVGTAFTVLLLVFYKFVLPFLNFANHRRVRSVCCGRSCTSSLDVEDTTPVPKLRSGVAKKGGVVDVKVHLEDSESKHTSLTVSRPSSDT